MGTIKKYSFEDYILLDEIDSNKYESSYYATEKPTGKHCIVTISENPQVSGWVFTVTY